MQYRHYVLGVLTLVYVFSFYCRNVVVILLEPIKLDLGLSDQQLGLLSGTVFALFYTVLGIPIARLADRTVRKNIIAVALATWSLMTVLSGFAAGFVHLILARIGLGIGQAGCTPPAHSLISEFFDPRQRTFAISVYSIGPPVGVFFAYSLGGWVSDQYGWRSAFFWAGAPGLLVAALVWLTIREPARAPSTNSAGELLPEDQSLWSVLGFLWSLSAWRYLMLGAGLLGLGLFGPMVTWTPSYLVRAFGLSTTEAGAIIGPLSLVMGASAVLIGGFLANRLANRSARWLLLMPTLSVLCTLVLYLMVFLSSTLNVLVPALGAMLFFASLGSAAQFSSAQLLSPPSMRAVSSSVMLFSILFVGFGLGPQLTGLISDLTYPRFGTDSLRIAILCTSPLIVLAAFSFYLGSRSIVRDAERSETLTSATARAGPAP